MQNYIEFTVKDFMLDDAFCRWVIQNSETDNHFWNNWLLENPHQIKNVETAKEIIKKIRAAHEEISESDLNAEIRRFSDSRKLFSVTPQIDSPKGRLIDFTKLWKVAAVFLVGVFGVIYLSKQSGFDEFSFQKTAYKKRTEDKKEVLEEVINDSEKTKLVDLPDGSQVTLSKHSRVSYPKSFSTTQREVYLSGEAFFEVTKNPHKPFVVYANELATRVLGTSFTISSYDKEEEVKVIVKTGKVAVFPLNNEDEVLEKKPEVMLTPNQKVVFNRVDNQMKRSIVATPEPLKSIVPTSKYLVFENTPVTQVFEKLYELYNIPMVYDNTLMVNCRITAELGNQPLFEKLDLICRAIDAKYEVIDGQIVIHGKKCN